MMNKNVLTALFVSIFSRKKHLFVNQKLLPQYHYFNIHNFRVYRPTACIISNKAHTWSRYYSKYTFEHQTSYYLFIHTTVPVDSGSCVVPISIITLQRNRIEIYNWAYR